MVSAAAVAPASDKSDSQAGKKDKPAATVPLVFRPEGTAKVLTTDGSLTVPANSLFSAAAASIVLRPLTEWNDDKKNLPDYKEILKLTVEDFEDDNTIHKSFHITKNDGNPTFSSSSGRKSCKDSRHLAFTIANWSLVLQFTPTLTPTSHPNHWGLTPI